MSPLESALVAIVSSDRRRPPFSIRVTTHYDPEYLAAAFERMTSSSTRRGSGRIGRLGKLGKLAGRLRNPRIPHHPSFVGAHLRLFGNGHWRYDNQTECGDVAVSYGYDGFHCWSQVAGGASRKWAPAESSDPCQLPESAWQFYASLVVREVMEPVLLVPALAISEAVRFSSDFGGAIRLHGSPQHEDRVESALVNMSATSCLVDVHEETGVVIGATGLDDDGDVLVRHAVEMMDYTGERS
jgi:hypothetical protein